MSISYGPYNIADARISGVSAVRGIGFTRLQFSLELSINATPPDYSVLVSSPISFVSAGRAQSGPLLPLGNAVAETCWNAQTKDQSQRDAFLVILDLSGEQLAALERLRAGGLLFFRVDVHMLTQGKDGLQRAFEQLWFEANLSIWSKLLKDIGYLELLLLSVDLPIVDVPKELENAIAQIREAHTDLIAGRYDAAVSRARLGLDSIDALVNGEGARREAIKAFNSPENRRMSKGARADLVRAAIRHYSHLAHHVNSSGGVECFSRHEATFILTAAAAVIWDAIGNFRSNVSGEPTQA